MTSLLLAPSEQEGRRIEERLLGFDVREVPQVAAGLWDGARRTTFLLRPEVRWPLSVDTLVWPSRFDAGQGIGLPAPERERLYLAGIPLPPDAGPNAGLWEDAARMLAHLNAIQAAGGVNIAYSGDVDTLVKESVSKPAGLNTEADNGNAQLIVWTYAFCVHVIILFLVNGNIF
jgi:hypothetical protein